MSAPMHLRLDYLRTEFGTCVQLHDELASQGGHSSPCRTGLKYRLIRVNPEPEDMIRKARDPVLGADRGSAEGGGSDSPDNMQ
jgi:hypothetical protein